MVLLVADYNWRPSWSGSEASGAADRRRRWRKPHARLPFPSLRSEWNAFESESTDWRECLQGILRRARCRRRCWSRAISARRCRPDAPLSRSKSPQPLYAFVFSSTCCSSLCEFQVASSESDWCFAQSRGSPNTKPGSVTGAAKGLATRGRV